MTARAALATERRLGGSGRVLSRISVLRSDAPLVLRPTLPKGPEPLVRHVSGVARVSLAAGAAGPLGGDDYFLDIRVGRGTTLVLNEISATLLLPGPRGGRSHMRTSVLVEDDAAFVWLSEPIIAAHGCDHVHAIDVSLAPRARLCMRDELLLGRHRESPGNLTQSLHVRRGGLPLFQQQLRIGPAARGWASPAVLGNNKCIGTVLVVDPAWAGQAREAKPLGRDAAVLPLEAPAVVISALAASSCSLRRVLEHGIELLGEPWAFAAAEPGPVRGRGAAATRGSHATCAVAN
jgi:urease accessory protein